MEERSRREVNNREKAKDIEKGREGEGCEKKKGRK